MHMSVMHSRICSFVQSAMYSNSHCDTRTYNAAKFLGLVRLHPKKFDYFHVKHLFRTFLTHSFIEMHIWHTLLDVIVIFLYSKMIEPLWGTRELIKFYFLITIPNALSVACIYFLFYGLTFNDEYLFERPIYGLAAFIGAYSVVIKQLMPDTILISTPLLQLKQDQVPLIIVCLTFVLWLLNGIPIHFFLMLTFGIVLSWTYLR